MPASLVISRGRNQGNKYLLTDHSVQIGRDKSNCISVMDTEVSRFHCQVLIRDNEIVIEDKQSSNGTFVNGKRIQRTILSSDDSIRIGKTELVFDYGSVELSDTDYGQNIDSQRDTDNLANSITESGVDVDALIRTTLESMGFYPHESDSNRRFVQIENKTFYEQLIEKEQLVAIGETTIAIAHHVKNILQGINGGTHLIESGLETNDLGLVRNGWQIVNRNQEEISRLVIDMVTLGRTYEPVLKPANLTAAVEQAISSLQNKMDQQQIQCIQETCSDHNFADLKFDFDRVSSSIQHLFHCCMMVLGDVEDRQIRWRLKKTDRVVSLIISDNGEAITFSEVDAGNDLLTLQSHQKMFGIGLSVARKIIMAHGGSFEIDCRSGQGNRFILSLPI